MRPAHGQFVLSAAEEIDMTSPDAEREPKGRPETHNSASTLLVIFVSAFPMKLCPGACMEEGYSTP